MKTQFRRCFVSFVIAAGFSMKTLALPIEVSDVTGDSSGLDLTRLSYNVTNNAIEVRLDFVENLEGAFGSANGIVCLDLDLDRSLISGFIGGPDWHPRIGVDYRIEIALSGFGAAYATGFLWYWRHNYDAGFIVVEKVQIGLGDFLFPNGSVLVVGSNATYGTDAHQVFVHIPLSLFNNDAFPICGTASFCFNTLYPCPLPRIPDARSALLCASVRPAVPFTMNDIIDWVPDRGTIDAASGGLQAPFPVDDQDLAVQNTDPVGDPMGGTALNGEDLTALRCFRHADDVLTFELRIAGVNMANTAVYYIVLDADDNPSTGEPFNNGIPMGVDMIAMFSIPDNQVGEPNSLIGELMLWQGSGYCSLPDYDCLGVLNYGSPGYAAISLPKYLLAPYLASNQSGQLKVLAGTAALHVMFTGFDDVVPDKGALTFPVVLAAPGTLRITSLDRQASGVLRLRCASTGGSFSDLALESSSELAGPWLREPMTLTHLDGGVYEGLITNSASLGARFFRIVGTVSTH